MPRKLSLLDDVRIASPCSVPWDGMTGDERVRFCPQCRLNVYNLSAMSRADAEEAVRRRETARVCIGLYLRSDGTVLTQDCPFGAAAVAGLRTARRRLCLLACAALLLLLGAFYTLTRWVDGTRNQDGQAAHLRDVEPYRTVLRWLAPEPSPPPSPKPQDLRFGW